MLSHHLNQILMCKFDDMTFAAGWQW